MTDDKTPASVSLAFRNELSVILSEIQGRLRPAIASANLTIKGKYPGGYRKPFIEEVVLPYLDTVLTLAEDVASRLAKAKTIELESELSLAQVRACFKYLNGLDIAKLAEGKSYCGVQEQALKTFEQVLASEKAVLEAREKLAELELFCCRSRALLVAACTEPKALAVLKAESADELALLPSSLSTLQIGYHYQIEDFKPEGDFGIIQRGSYIPVSAEEAGAYFDIVKAPVISFTTDQER